LTRTSAAARQQRERQEEKTQQAKRKMKTSEETMALMSMATVAISPGKDNEMEGISKKENKRRQSRRGTETEAKKEDTEKAREEEAEQPERGNLRLERDSTGYREPFNWRATNLAYFFIFIF